MLHWENILMSIIVFVWIAHALSWKRVSVELALWFRRQYDRSFPAAGDQLLSAQMIDQVCEYIHSATAHPILHNA